MAKLGYVWWPHENAWVWLGYMDEPRFWIAYLPSTKQWEARGVVASHHDETVVGPLAAFPDPITAAVWLATERADEQARHRRRQREAWKDWGEERR